MAPDSSSIPAASLGALASRFIEIDAMKWTETPNPGMSVKVLYHDPKTDQLTLLTRLAPGAGIPEHTHDDIEQTMVLEGSLVDAEGICKAGNMVIRAKGSRHAPVAPEGCLMLVFFAKGTALIERLMTK